mmetsp:Transcript_62608/g.152424  ORF Transcript_62608/g.152424 Transcript_62608/m.152424 type:complete len:348 (-) Transcript_62608:219-1262(-)
MRSKKKNKMRSLTTFTPMAVLVLSSASPTSSSSPSPTTTATTATTTMYRDPSLDVNRRRDNAAAAGTVEGSTHTTSLRRRNLSRHHKAKSSTLESSLSSSLEAATADTDSTTTTTAAAAATTTLMGSTEVEWIKAFNQVVVGRHVKDSFDKKNGGGGVRILSSSHRDSSYDVTERDVNNDNDKQLKNVDKSNTVDPTSPVSSSMSSTPSSSTSHVGGAGNVRIQQTKRLHSPLSSSMTSKQEDTEQAEAVETQDNGQGEEDVKQEFDLQSNTNVALLRHEDPPQEQFVEGDSIFFPESSSSSSSSSSSTTTSNEAVVVVVVQSQSERDVPGDNIFANDVGVDEDDKN